MSVIEVLRTNESAEVVLNKLKRMDEARLRELYYLAQGMELASKKRTGEEVNRNEDNKPESGRSLLSKTTRARGTKKSD